jgi:hypothetical protein
MKAALPDLLAPATSSLMWVEIGRIVRVGLYHLLDMLRVSVPGGFAV